MATAATVVLATDNKHTNRIKQPVCFAVKENSVIGLQIVEDA